VNHQSASNMKRTILLSLAILSVFGGCSEPAASVQGTVTIDGQIARQGTVVFHPVDEGSPVAYGAIAEDGSYALRVGQGDLNDPDAGEVPIGEYVVTVVSTMPASPDEKQGKSTPPTPGARLSAEKYGSKETSELRHTVKLGHNVVPLEVEGASADEMSEEIAGGEAPTTDEATGVKAADEVTSPEAEAAPENSPSDEPTASPEQPPETSPPASEGDVPAATGDAEPSATEETP
jgi:hypothetical protein